MFDVAAAVVGAGVVGLAVGARLVRAGLSVMVLEQHPGPGRETSSRNSEVMHAGLYYPPGSLKARLCVRGNRELYSFCEKNNIGHRRIGKLVVAASEDEVEGLHDLRARGHANGAETLSLLTPRQVAALEPHVRCVEALHSPSTGIIDSHGLIKTLAGHLRDGGGHLVCQCRVIGIEAKNPGFRLQVENPSGQEAITCRLLVNCAGLHADRVAALAGLKTPVLNWCKGDYFSLGGPSGRLASRLVYPAPVPRMTSLGIHFTLDLGGRARLGPDATYVDRERCSLAVDPDKSEIFFKSVRRYLPDLRREDLQPDTSGIRPKLQGPGDPVADFQVRDESDAGLPGLVTLLGIESPGLTSCLPLADLVLDTLRHHL